MPTENKPVAPITAAEKLDAVLHWRDKHTQAIRERDALQLSLNAADQRIDELSYLLQHLIDNPFRFTDTYRARIAAALKPAEAERDLLANQSE